MGTRTALAKQQECNGGTHLRHRFDERIDTTLVTIGRECFGMAIPASKVETSLSLSRLGSHGTVGWPVGVAVALTRGTVGGLVWSSQPVVRIWMDAMSASSLPRLDIVRLNESRF